MEAQKIVPFKIHEGISTPLLTRLLEKGKTYGLQAIFPFKTEQILVAHWVSMKCRYGCNRFNTNWCCPPTTPDPETTRAMLSEYSLALLLVGTQSCPEFYRNNARKRKNQVQYWKGTVSLERLLFLEGYYKAFSLVGETCALCKECSFPESCRFPQERRPSLESFSIDVIGTLKNLGRTPKVANRVNETYNYYGMILLE